MALNRALARSSWGNGVVSHCLPARNREHQAIGLGRVRVSASAGLRARGRVRVGVAVEIRVWKGLESMRDPAESMRDHLAEE